MGGERRRWEVRGGEGRRWEVRGGEGRRWEERGGEGRRWEVRGGDGSLQNISSDEMSTALLRRNSSKLGLQNLLRVTAQRSVEDAEEVEREQRRRAREARRRSADPQEESAADLYDGELKAGQPSSLEEDEGFSDGGALRRERARRQTSQDSREEEVLPKESIYVSSQPRLRRQERQEEEKEEQQEATNGRMRMERGDEARREREKEEVVTRDVREVGPPPPSLHHENRKLLLVLCVNECFHVMFHFLQQEVVHSNTNGNTTPQEVTSYMNMKTKRLIGYVGLLKEKENQGQLRPQEAEQELEELKRRREERRRVREEELLRLPREEEERRRVKEEQDRRRTQEGEGGAGQEERRRVKEEQDRRRTQATDRMKTLSCSSPDQEEMLSPVCPRTPTPKISERTESLSRSLKKSNSFKKTQSPVLMSRLDDRLEQYANAIEDTEGLKVGVANLITQWVKGSPDSSGKAPPSRPAEVKPGDVMQKKNMWEGIGDTRRTGPSGPTAGSFGSSSLFLRPIRPISNTVEIFVRGLDAASLNFLASNLGLKSRMGSRWANAGISLDSSFVPSLFFSSSLLLISIWCMMFSLVENIWKRTASHILAPLGASWLDVSLFPSGFPSEGLASPTTGPPASSFFSSFPSGNLGSSCSTTMCFLRRDHPLNLDFIPFGFPRTLRRTCAAWDESSATWLSGFAAGEDEDIESVDASAGRSGAEPSLIAGAPGFDSWVLTPRQLQPSVLQQVLGPLLQFSLTLPLEFEALLEWTWPQINRMLERSTGSHHEQRTQPASVPDTKT
ncbi:Non-muscle caldesmon [Merluccius polli]|uniref:Non-muscle caldesmon n=1 Tax=Merluccius polli TaxID=89951 RepID=A0AA47PAZ3_MERPO|nr:Non-muscle caldesmon [Merluccius polli]